MTWTAQELRCRCAYNTSLNTTTPPTKAESCAPPAQQATGCAVADPCAPPRNAGCCVAAQTPPRCGDEAPRPCDRTDVPAAAATGPCCDKPKSRCDDAERAGGVMNICEKPPGGSRCEDARPCGATSYERDGPWSCDPNVCKRLNDGCGGYDLTPYGQQFDICTERVIKKCACVKFNGLQDSCKHPDCCIRRGCLDKPFPTCPPARKWRFTNVCCRDKMKKICKPECK